MAVGEGAGWRAWASECSGSDSSQARKRLHASPSRAETEREAETQTGSRALGIKKLQPPRERVTQTASQPSSLTTQQETPASNTRLISSLMRLRHVWECQDAPATCSNKTDFLGRRAGLSSQDHCHPSQRDGSTAAAGGTLVRAAVADAWAEEVACTLRHENEAAGVT